MIAILTSPDDVHANHVESELRRRGASWVRFDPGDISREGGAVVARLGRDSERLVLRTPAIEVDLTSVRTVWARRPSRPRAHSDIRDEFFSGYVERGWPIILDDLYLATDARWLPGRPAEIRRADSKIAQLRLARRLGLSIPETLLTSDAAAVFDFHRSNDCKTISKLPASFLLHGPTPPFGRFTERLLRSDLGYIAASSRLGPCLYQREIAKSIELRVTVIGDRVFATAIHSQTNKRTSLDWRHYDLEHTPHRVHTLPADIADKCLKMTHLLGLRYSAIDLILSENGDYYFLEVNPNGQYLWLEEATGLPLTSAICDALLEE